MGVRSAAARAGGRMPFSAAAPAAPAGPAGPAVRPRVEEVHPKAGGPAVRPKVEGRAVGLAGRPTAEEDRPRAGGRVVGLADRGAGDSRHRAASSRPIPTDRPRTAPKGRRPQPSAARMPREGQPSQREARAVSTARTHRRRDGERHAQDVLLPLPSHVLLRCRTPHPRRIPCLTRSPPRGPMTDPIAQEGRDITPPPLHHPQKAGAKSGPARRARADGQRRRAEGRAP